MFTPMPDVMPVPKVLRGAWAQAAFWIEEWRREGRLVTLDDENGCQFSVQRIYGQAVRESDRELARMLKPQIVALLRREWTALKRVKPAET